MTATIAALEARLIEIPLSRPWGPEVTEIRVIEVVITASDGATGRGFSWTPSIGAHAVHALLTHDISAFAVGRPADPSIWRTCTRPAAGASRRSRSRGSISPCGICERTAATRASPTSSAAGTTRCPPTAAA